MNIRRKITAVLLSVLTAGGLLFGSGNIYSDEAIVTVSAAEKYTYTCDYIYNILETNAEREFYDRLHECCQRVQDSSADYVGTPYVEFSDLVDYDRAMEIAWLFYYDQPEFFWISSSFRISSDMGISYGIYDEYTDGSERQKALSEIMAEAQKYIDGANQYTTDYDKAKYLRDELVENISYVEGVYDQSIASVFLLGETVCAGYTKAYSMLCNAVGVDAVSITGYVHGWNAVRIYDRWYLVDVTNDTPSYDLFLISESTMRQLDIESGISYSIKISYSSGTTEIIEAYMHDIDDQEFPTYYDDYPYCPLDYNSVIISITEASKGDITCDNKVNLYDAIEIARYIMNMRDFNNDELYIADYNCDNEVNLYDVIEIAKLIMG